MARSIFLRGFDQVDTFAFVKSHCDSALFHVLFEFLTKIDVLHPQEIAEIVVEAMEERGTKFLRYNIQ